MTPDLARRLARVYPSLSTAATGVAGVAGVAAVARYASKPQQLRPLRPLRAKTGKEEKVEGERVAAVLDAVAEAIEERKALLSCPETYRDAFARLNHQKPFAVTSKAWERAVNDAGLFFDAWGKEVANFGWTAGDLLDVPRAGCGGGLIWNLAGERVEALGADHARLGDGRVIMRREEIK